MLRLSRLSKEKIKIQVTASGNPTSFSVEVAFKREGEPVSADWKAATWSSSGGSYYAEIVIGPGSTYGELTPGFYSAWVRVTALTETPVKTSSALQIY
jgi:hypothetical protein